MATIENEIGKIYGRLTVLGRAENNKYGQAMWQCRCFCGELTTVVGSSLRRNYIPTRSCGCLRREKTADKNRHNAVHGAKKNFCETVEYRAYVSAKGRCINSKNPSYPAYGGRGIEFRFTNFQEFLNEVGLRPSPLHSLDRINNDGHYEKGNLRWATKEAQANNRRTYHETLIRRISKLESQLKELRGF